MTCHGVPSVVISNGRVVLEEGNLLVSQGAGRFVETPCFSDYVYSRVAIRDTVIILYFKILYVSIKT